MIWIIRLFLFLYALLYIALGGWAIIEPGRMELFGENFPSFMQYIGLSVTSPIGYSEIAGIYGGINIMLGLIALIGVFVNRFAKWACSLLIFLCGSIFLGRYVFSILHESIPGNSNIFFLYNDPNWYAIFEFASFFIFLIFLIFLNLQTKKDTKHKEAIDTNQ